MKNFLTNATKKRIIRELKKILYDHPRYRGDSENVQAKYAFPERPQRGIIVNNTSADRVRLSADNYVAKLSSFVMSSSYQGAPATSIEWVIENQRLLEKYSKRRNIFPTAPGEYLITIKCLPDDALNIPGQFTVDPILTVITEPTIIFTSSSDQTSQISRENIYPGSDRLLLNGRTTLIRDVDYSIDYASGYIQFLKPTPAGQTVYADYRYVLPQMGPFPFYREQSDQTTIPGAVIAFGDRPQINDKIAIQVTDVRTDTADIFGGKFEVNFDLIVFSKDSEDRERLSDYVVVKIMEMQNRLGFEGLELIDVSPGGENEEVFNAKTDEYFYESTVSMSMRVDWEIWLPLPFVVQRFEFTSRSAEKQHGYLDGSAPLDLLIAANAAKVNSLPVFIGKDLTFERVTSVLWILFSVKFLYEALHHLLSYSC